MLICIVPKSFDHIHNIQYLAIKMR